MFFSTIKEFFKTKLYNLELGSEFEPWFDDSFFAYEVGEKPPPVIGISDLIEGKNFKNYLKSLRETIIKVQKKGENPKIPIGLGGGCDTPVGMVDIQKMPHMLVGGATGWGKSIFLYNMMVSNTIFSHPDYLKIAILDASNNGFREVKASKVASVIDTHNIVPFLKRVKDEIVKRGEALRKAKKQDIVNYNRFCAVSKTTLMPFWVIYFDEFQGFSLSKVKEKRDVYDEVLELVAITRKYGIHFVFSTQAPYSSVVSNLLKANTPCKVGFGATNPYASKTNIGNTDAYTDIKLIGEFIYHEGREYKKFRSFNLLEHQRKQYFKNLKGLGINFCIDK